MNDTQIKAHIIEYARQIDQMEALMSQIDKDMENLTSMYTATLKMYNDTADRIETLVRQMEDQEKIKAALSLIYNLKQKKAGAQS